MQYHLWILMQLPFAVFCMLVFLMVARIAILVLLRCQCGALLCILWCSYVASVVYLYTDCDSAELSLWLPEIRVCRLWYSFIGSAMSLYIDCCRVMYPVLCPYIQIVVQLCFEYEVFIYRSCTSTCCNYGVHVTNCAAVMLPGRGPFTHQSYWHSIVFSLHVFPCQLIYMRKIYL